MGARRSNINGSTGSTPQPARPVERDYVADVQRRVAALTNATEQTLEPVAGSTLASKQRQQVEQEMASLRAEALKARRLAEQIENLSQQSLRPERKRVMTETSTMNPGHSGQQQRRKNDASKSGGSPLSFNPLHPSMELPPEQLIRLLGLETEKIRKGRKTSRRTQEPPHTAPARAVDAKPQRDLPATARPAASRPESPAAPFIPPVARERRPTPTRGANRRIGLMLPALVIGVVVGGAATGYLFLSKPPIASTPIPVAVPRANNTPDIRTQPAGTPSGTDNQASGLAPTQETIPAPASSAEHDVEAVVDPERQAAIDAELARLQAEAELRFARRMSRIEASRELGELPAQPGYGAQETPLPARQEDEQPPRPDDASSNDSLPHVRYEEGNVDTGTAVAGVSGEEAEPEHVDAGTPPAGTVMRFEDAASALPEQDPLESDAARADNLPVAPASEQAAPMPSRIDMAPAPQADPAPGEDAFSGAAADDPTADETALF